MPRLLAKLYSIPFVSFLAKWIFILLSPIWSPLPFILHHRSWLWLQNLMQLLPASTFARAEARLKPTHAATLAHYRLQMNQLSSVALWAEQLRQTSYDEKLHAAQFTALWTALRPDTPPPPIPSSSWGDIGFQGKDPSTDLRGTGIAGLAFLIDFAQTFPEAARRALLQASHPKHWMPFACAGINLTAFILKELLGAPSNQRRLLAPHMMQHGTTPEQLRVVFSHLMVELCNAYIDAAPENLLAFPSIMSAFQARVRTQLAYTGVLFNNISDTGLVKGVSHK